MLAVIAGALLASLATGQSDATVTGPVRIVDGDTIDVGAVRVRLFGIDAPESGQTCAARSGGTWACGEEASRVIAQLIEGRTARCESRGLDGYQRTLAICFVGDIEINAEMVRRGLAWAFIKYSGHYLNAEAEARAMKIGIWQAATRPPWEWRAHR